MTPATDDDAITVLREDHFRIREMLRQFHSLAPLEDAEAQCAQLLDELCDALTIHAMLEQELFYPALRAAIDADERIDEAESQHAGSQDLVRQLEVMYPGDEHFDATLAVLTEEFAQHVAFEEVELMPCARRSGIDLHALGERLQRRRDELEIDLRPPPVVHSNGGDRRRSVRRPPRSAS